MTALRDPEVAAVFGRQIPRPDCQAVFAHDYERCFGHDRESAKWEHFCSMASSGVRKDIWAKRGFNEQMQYSEAWPTNVPESTIRRGFLIAWGRFIITVPISQSRLNPGIRVYGRYGFQHRYCLKVSFYFSYHLNLFSGIPRIHKV